MRLAEPVAAAAAVVVLVVFPFLSVAFLVAAIASTAQAQDVVAPQRSRDVVAEVLQLQQRISALEMRISALEADVKSLKSAKSSSPGSHEVVWVEMLSPDDDSCPPCSEAERDLRRELSAAKWKVGGDGHVRFRKIPNDGATFPRFVVYSNGEEVLRLFGRVTPARLADILNREIKLSQ